MSIDLDPIASGYNLSKINSNFQKVENELNNNVLRRNGVGVGEPNSMDVDLDMNSHSILNAKVNGIDLDDLVNNLEDKFAHSIRTDLSENDLNILPPPVARQGKLISFDSAGNVILVNTPDSSIILPYVTASDFGFTGVGNESVLADAYLDYCSTTRKTAYIDMDVDWDGLQWRGNNLTLSGPGKITGFIKIFGDIIRDRTSTVTIGTAGNYTTYPTGTTTFFGNFSGYGVGQKIVIELNETANFNGAQNQIGLHFSTVVSSSGTQLVIADATRWPFDKMDISKTSFLAYTGTLSRGTYSISGDFSFLSEGEIVRFENLSGTDAVDGTARYFEHVRVKSASNTTLILADHLEYTHTNPIIVPAAFIDNINIHDANLDILQLRAITRLSASNMKGARSINDYIYNGIYNAVNLQGSSPNIFNLTYGRNVSLTGVIPSGAAGTTDNAAFKMMSPINCTVDGIISSDYGVTSGVQSINGFYVDYAFTPYQCWGTLNCSNLKIGPTKGGLGFWFDGIRRSRLMNITSEATSRLFECTDLIADISTTSGLFLRNTDSATITARAQFIQCTGCQNTQLLDCITTGPANNNANRNISIGGSTLNTISNRMSIRNWRNETTTAVDVGLFFGNVNGLEVIGSQDRSGITSSVANSGSNITAPINFALNDFKNSISIGSLASRSQFECDVEVGTATTSAFDRHRLRLGSSYLWQSSVGLRFSSTSPGSDGAGLPLSMFVPVPATATSAGLQGQWSSDGNFLYTCHTTNVWRRVAIVSW